VFRQGFPVAVENGVAGLFRLEGKMSFLGRQNGACRQPQQVIGIRQLSGFVEIIYALN